MDPVNYLRALTATPGSVAFGGATDIERDPRIGPAVEKQIAAAKLKQNLPDYRKAEDMSLFWYTASDVFEAHLKAAYWLAVAARCSQAWKLTDLAVEQQVAGNAGKTWASRMIPSSTSWDRAKAYWHATMPAVVPLSTGDQAAISAILKSAGAAILAAAPTNGGAKAAAAALGQIGDPETIRAMEQTRADQGASGILLNTGGAIVDDVASISEATRSLFTGKVPRGWTLEEWDAFKMKAYVAGGLVVAGTGVYLFGPAIRGASRYAGASMDVGAQRSAGRARLIRDLT